MKKFKFTLIAAVLLASCSQKATTVQTVEGYIPVDNVKLYYRTVGSGDTLMILHGGPGLSHKYLKPQLDSLLSENFTLLYYDQRGSGWSEGVEDTLKLNMRTYVSDLEQIRKHFKLPRLNLIGHSFGGLLAMNYGITYPEKLNSMVLVDTDAASYALRTPYQIKKINERISEDQWKYLEGIANSEPYKNFDVKAYEQYYKTFLTSYFYNPKDTLHLSLGFDSISIPKINVTSSFLRRGLGKYDIHKELVKIQCPTLILQGRESIFSVAGAEAIHKILPDSRLELFENCGHFEYIEAPEKFMTSIEEFYGMN
jgi:proline iminopeptidase